MAAIIFTKKILSGCLPINNQILGVTGLRQLLVLLLFETELPLKEKWFKDSLEVPLF